MARRIAPTSYALLGLLSIKSWTTYELARQSERSLRWFFPRAERGVYQEAKRLLDLGWAAADESWVGKRKATTYRITAPGRRAFNVWLGQPGAPLQFESECLMRVFLADRRRLDDIRTNIDALYTDASSALEQLGAMAAQWGRGETGFRDRGPTNAVAMKLVTDLHRTVAEWADWAKDAIDQIEVGDDRAAQLADEVFADIARDAPTS